MFSLLEEDDSAKSSAGLSAKPTSPGGTTITYISDPGYLASNEEMASSMHPRRVVTERRTPMQRQPRNRHDRLQRIQLIGRVQLAYEQLKETMQRYHDDSPRARAAVAAAKRRLSVLNRALAIIALEVAQQPA